MKKGCQVQFSYSLTCGAAALLSLHFFTGSLPGGHRVPLTMSDPWMTTDESEIQEVNPPQTVAPPPYSLNRRLKKDI